MSVSSEEMSATSSDSKTLSYYLQDWKKCVLGVAAIYALYWFCVDYQQSYAHLYGMDSHSPEFDAYWMSFLYIELTALPVIGIVFWGYLWFTRDKNIDSVGPQEELQRYFSFVLLLLVYTFAVYYAASFFAEQDASWHQVVTRDTSFTPSHIILFYLSFPLYIIFGVASLIFAMTRLPMYHKHGVSLPHVLAVVGPFMILPNVGLNEWGHAFWFMEEIFTAPLHWGFVILGWSGLGLAGVLMQVVLRVNRLLPQI